MKKIRKMSDFHGEEASYPWPCRRCGKEFLPKRMTTFKTAPFQRCCDDCQTLNLLEMVFAPDEPEDNS